LVKCIEEHTEEDMPLGS